MRGNELVESLELSKAMSNAIMWQALGGMLRLFCWNSAECSQMHDARPGSRHRGRPSSITKIASPSVSCKGQMSA